MDRKLAASIVASLIGIALASCGGGGGGGGGATPVTPPGPKCPSGYTGTPPNCAAPTTGTTSFTTTTSGVQVAIPPVNGFGGTLSVPPANTAASMVLYSFEDAPSGVTVLSAKRRRFDQTPNTPYVYYLLQANAAVTLNGTMAFSFTPPSTAPSQNYYIAALAEDSTWFSVAGPSTISGGKLDFSVPLQIEYPEGGLAIALVLYAGNPVFSGVPLIAAPSSVVLMDLSAVQPLRLYDNDPNASVTIDASTCSGIVNVAQVRPTTFNFTAVTVGTCQVTASDSDGRSIIIPVAVQTTQVIVQ